MSRRGKPPTPPPLQIPDEDREAFARAMRGVRRLTTDEHSSQGGPPGGEPLRRPRPKPRARPRPHSASDTAAHLRGARSQHVDAGNPASHPDFEPRHANAGGRQLRRQVERGKLRPALTLDLHGATVAQAQGRLANFVERAALSGERCVIIVHGKGYNSPDGLPVLRPAVQAWLATHPQVVSHTLAADRHGGSGASYVLLRA